MRTAALAFSWFVFRSVTLFAQPFIGPEILSQPLASRNEAVSLAVPAIAMAKDRQSVAIAWAMRNAAGAERIHVVRLDATGRARGEVMEAPLSLPGDDIDAISPSIAVSESGRGFTLAWTEVPSRSSFISVRSVFCRLDGDLKPSSPNVLMTLPFVSPTIARSGKAAWLTSGGFVRRLRADGSLEGLLDVGVPASDMVATDPFPQVVSSNKIQGDFTCMPQQGCKVSGGPFNGFCFDRCRIYQYSYGLHYVALYTFSTVKTFAFDSDAQPAVQSEEHDVLFAWFRGAQASGGDVVAVALDRSSFANFEAVVEHPQVLGSFGPDSGPTRPDIATDGERYLVVWRTTSSTGDHDIIGSSIDRAGNITHLSIATSAADERDPSVIAISNGTFLVAYDKVSAGERRIAGRFVTFGSRRRAAR